MGSAGSPQAWVPYDNIKDCSQGFCSSYCPQWCYIIFPPPPPYDFMDEGSNPHFSPLVIAIIGILASAFLLASYYILISKYCGRNRASQGTGNRDPNEEFDENGELMNNEQWQALNGGLDETLIKSITVCKYKKGDGFVEETDCSVCLNEFQEDEKVRLLPKCSHAFHLSCIDTWLRDHSNCPLCRANIVISSPLPLQVLSQVHESPPEDEHPPERRRHENDAVVAEEAPERGDAEEDSQGRDGVPKTHSRASSDLGQLEQRDTIIEIREENIQPIRRSVSMDYCQSQISIADILEINQDDDSELEDNQVQMDVGSLKPRGEHSKSSNKSRALHRVMTPITMKRSFSSGRLFFTRHGRGRNTMIPL